jgi:hypothetical protein
MLYSLYCLKRLLWSLDLQLPVQSVPITTEVVSSNPAHGEVYSIQHYVIKFVCDLSVVFSRYSGFLQQWNWCHDITEILLKVALNTINQTKPILSPGSSLNIVHDHVSNKHRWNKIGMKSYLVTFYNYDKDVIF